ncbi:MAG: DNA transposition protein [Arcobacter sp.]|nr:MAG: DNA transposition protein [Arcobacter sp.]
MKDTFLHTRNYNKFYEAIQGVEDLPKSAPKMGLAYGKFGLGKTMSLERIAAEKHALLFRAVQTWNKTSVLRELCIELRVDPQGNASFLYQRIKKKLLQEPRMIIVDEVDAILKYTKNEVLELFRDIHDECGVVVFFIGMEEAKAKFARHTHYESRIVEFVEFEDISKEEIREFCALSEVKIEEDLIEHFHKRFPNLRQIRVFLIRLEKICKLNGIGEVNLQMFNQSGVNHVSTRSKKA